MQPPLLKAVRGIFLSNIVGRCRGGLVFPEVASNRQIGRDFFDRPCLEVARDLIGVLLVRRLANGARLVGRLVEVEAYLGDGSDPGSHSWRGPTERNRSMFGPPGRFYAYLCYGMHTCVNLVCEKKGAGAAVLLRALEPLEGIETMRANRRLQSNARGRVIASGPGRLAQAMGLSLEIDGESALRGPLSLRTAVHPPRVGRSPRVGLSRGPTLPYRFFDADSPLVGRWRAPKPRRD